jgi:hypothetical protein
MLLTDFANLLQCARKHDFKRSSELNVRWKTCKPLRISYNLCPRLKSEFIFLRLSLREMRSLRAPVFQSAIRPRQSLQGDRYHVWLSARVLCLKKRLSNWQYLIAVRHSDRRTRDLTKDSRASRKRAGRVQYASFNRQKRYKCRKQ